jgi:hypothetical protein
MKQNPSMRFDWVHVDGGHDGMVPFLDIENMEAMSWKADPNSSVSNGTIVVVDDCSDAISVGGERSMKCLDLLCFPEGEPDGTSLIVSRAWDQFKVAGRVDKITPGISQFCDIGNCVGRYRKSDDTDQQTRLQDVKARHNLKLKDAKSKQHDRPRELHELMAEIWHDHALRLQGFVGQGEAATHAADTVARLKLKLSTANAEAESAARGEKNNFNYGPAVSPIDLKSLHEEANQIVAKYAGTAAKSSLISSERSQCVHSVAQGARETIGEIGLDAGHTAAMLLATFPRAHLYEFDECTDAHSVETIAWILGRFPGRVTITCGDSTRTLPKFALENPSTRFDFVHMGGSQANNIPFMNLANLANMSWAAGTPPDQGQAVGTRKTVVVVDDCSDDVAVSAEHGRNTCINDV